MEPAEAHVRLSLIVDEQTKKTVPYLEYPALDNITMETRKAWINSITKSLMNTTKAEAATNIRNWDLHLNTNGTVENVEPEHGEEKTPLKIYPSRYRLPSEIFDRQNTIEEQIFRMESFALGGVFYEMLMGKPVFGGVDDLGSIHEQIAEGRFPDIWQQTMAERILVAWCPPFGQVLLNKPFLQKFSEYAHRNPFKFGATVLGGAAAVIGLGTPLILGAAGFGAGGVAAGSIAAGLQSSIGLVQAGSIFAWCQSVGAGGAALGALLGVGGIGTGVALGATLAGVLDTEKTIEEAEALKRKFLETWKRDMEGESTEKTMSKSEL
ncbi:hypothetical protein HYFRA_00004170 [Hymenoscyphus fraxineus]|uniref:Uncharacterized protein n=1 Tax=Hymenoscyphus fraxineus TaxID=746836 RepID=A0A9N9KNC2_9HELO|nr:hypothetical protein HYFRA_00004170 [Hymenoscyphus fraxineus]